MTFRRAIDGIEPTWIGVHIGGVVCVREEQRRSQQTALSAGYAVFNAKTLSTAIGSDYRLACTPESCRVLSDMARPVW
jgi:hypothetical protein